MCLLFSLAQRDRADSLLCIFHVFLALLLLLLFWNLLLFVVMFCKALHRVEFNLLLFFLCFVDVSVVWFCEFRRCVCCETVYYVMRVAGVEVLSGVAWRGRAARCVSGGGVL